MTGPSAARRPYAPRPAGFGLPISDAETAAVLAEFGIGDGWSMSPPAGTHPAGTTWHAVITHLNAQYLIKQVPWYCDHRPHADAVAEVQHALGSLSDLVLRPERTRSGGLLAALPGSAIDKRLFMLRPFVPGLPWRPVRLDCSAAGRALGTLHGLMRSGQVEAVAGEVVRHDAVSTAHAALTRLAEQATDLQCHLRADWQRLVTTSRELLTQAQANAERRGYGAATMLAHGDLNPANLLFTAHGLVRAFVDFDNCAWDHPAHDVARLAVHVGWLQSDGRTDRFRTRVPGARPDLAAAAIEGYRQTSPVWDVARPPLGAVAGCITAELVALGAINGWFGLAAAQAWLHELPVIAASVSACAMA